MQDLRSRLPNTGLAGDELGQELSAWHRRDTAKRWDTWSLRPQDDVRAVASDIVGRVLGLSGETDWTSPLAIKLTRELASFVRPWFHAPDDSRVLFTASGSESNLLALKAARDAMGDSASRDRPMEAVVTTTAHPSLDKAADLLGMRIVRAATDRDGRANVAAMEASISAKTAAIVASVPSDARGTCDPVADIAALADKRGLWCHVDACLGGYLVPFLRELGHDLPAFGFDVPGVSSVSADLHKYGYAPTGISTLLLRRPRMINHIRYVFDDWDGGPYSREVIAGTRSVAPVAGAWATLLQLGHHGMIERSRKVASTTSRIAAMIEQRPSLKVLSTPEAGMVHFGALDEGAGVPNRLVGSQVRGNVTRHPPGFIIAVGPGWNGAEVSTMIAIAEGGPTPDTADPSTAALSNRPPGS